jgi:hypothetical protein
MLCRRSFIRNSIAAAQLILWESESWSAGCQSVTFGGYGGGGHAQSWIQQGCNGAGVPYNKYWANGFMTLCKREASYNPNAVNNWDKNATGPIVSDGHRLNCSRGLCQCIPGTFTTYHADGTSWDIYDPEANIAAAIRYVRKHYGVSAEGSNFAAKVQQANPNLPPRGYFPVPRQGVPDPWVDEQHRVSAVRRMGMC